MMQWRLLGHESSSEILIISLGTISRNKIEFLEKKKKLLRIFQMHIDKL